MNKTIDIKKRIVTLSDIETKRYEDEIVGFLNRQMKVKFENAIFNNQKYVFLGDTKDYVYGAIVISSYRNKLPNESTSVLIS